MAFLDRWQPAAPSSGNGPDADAPADAGRRDAAAGAQHQPARSPHAGLRPLLLHSRPAGRRVRPGRGRAIAARRYPHGAARPGRPDDGGVAARRAPRRQHRPGPAAARRRALDHDHRRRRGAGVDSPPALCAPGRCPTCREARPPSCARPASATWSSSRSTTRRTWSPERRGCAANSAPASSSSPTPAPRRSSGSRAARSPTPCRSNRGTGRRCCPWRPRRPRDVTLPPAALSPATLSVTSATGFRPSELRRRRPRHAGCWASTSPGRDRTRWRAAVQNRVVQPKYQPLKFSVPPSNTRS